MKKKLVYVRMIFRQADLSSVRLWQKLKSCNFLGLYNYDKCESLHDGSAYRALLIYTTFSDLVCISRSQQRQTVLIVNNVLCSCAVKMKLCMVFEYIK